MTPHEQGYFDAYMDKNAAGFSDYLQENPMASKAINGVGGAAIGAAAGGLMGGRGMAGPGAALGGIAMAVADHYGFGLDEAWRWIQKNFLNKKTTGGAPAPSKGLNITGKMPETAAAPLAPTPAPVPAPAITPTPAATDMPPASPPPAMPPASLDLGTKPPAIDTTKPLQLGQN